MSRRYRPNYIAGLLMLGLGRCCLLSFSVNSEPYDDKRTPSNAWLTVFLFCFQAKILNIADMQLQYICRRRRRRRLTTNTVSPADDGRSDECRVSFWTFLWMALDPRLNSINYEASTDVSSSFRAIYWSRPRCVHRCAMNRGCLHVDYGGVRSAACPSDHQLYWSFYSTAAVLDGSWCCCCCCYYI